MKTCKVVIIEHDVVISNDNGSWDTRVKSGPGSMEPYASRWWKKLAQCNTEDQLAGAVVALDIYPPMLDGRDYVEIEDYLMRDR